MPRRLTSGAYSTLADVSYLNSCYTNGSPAPVPCPATTGQPAAAGVGDPDNPLNRLPGGSG